MEPKIPAHAHEMHGPIEPFGTLLTSYSDLSAANDGWAKMNSSGIVERLLGTKSRFRGAPGHPGPASLP